MCVRHAKELCPQLIIVPYNFEAYEEVEEFLNQLSVGRLPGVGSVLKEKLEKQNIQTCGQLRLISKDSLQKDFGVKTGEMLWSYCRGLDLRSVTAVQENKSIGAEVNWGVRFRDQQDIQHFLQCLCKEVSLRLQGCEMIGRTFTLKIKRRKKDAEEPTKYMGCGDCDNLSRSITVPAATDDVDILQRISKKLFGSFCLDVKEVRGVGLQVSKLDSADSSNKGSKTLTSWLSSAPTSVQTENNKNVFATEVRESSDCKRRDSSGVRLQESNSAEPSAQSGDTSSSLPPMCHLDMEVLENLPSELLSELDGTYGGKLFELIEKRRGKRKVNSSTPHVSLDSTAVNKGPKSLSVKIQGSNTSKEKEHGGPYEPHPSISRTSNERSIEMTDLMPSSLSQVDISVLQELPEELRADVLGAFPVHKRPQSSSDAPLETSRKLDEEPVGIRDTENEIGISYSSLWFGNPPQWVENFKVSGNCTLEKLSEIYYKANQSRPVLSSLLQQSISEIANFHDESGNGLDESVNDVCELLKQYMKLKVEGDIEEIYLCFRLLKRLAARSLFFLQVFDILSPFIQAMISEHYGGSLSID